MKIVNYLEEAKELFKNQDAFWLSAVDNVYLMYDLFFLVIISRSPSGYVPFDFYTTIVSYPPATTIFGGISKFKKWIMPFDSAQRHN